ncbi:MAG: VOC family protein [Acidimicrobiales bacterium]
MSIRPANVTFDCDDPQAVARFWSAVLERPVDDETNPYFASIGPGTSTQPTFLFLAVGESKAAKNRCHIDFESDDYPAEVNRLVGLGATKQADKAEYGHVWTVFNDPEGNEFCVSGPHAVG